MAQSTVHGRDIAAICQILLPRYKNVKLLQGLTNNKPDFRNQVKGLFVTEEKRFEVVGGDKKRPATKKKYYLHGYASSTEQSRNTPGMTGMLCCGTMTTINGMV